MAGETLTVNVNSLAGARVAAVELERTDTVAALKELIERTCQWPSEQQKLLLDSTIDLCPSGATLGDFAGDRGQLEVLLLKIFAEEVYFLGLSLNTLGAGISAKHCDSLGDQLTNANNHDRFKKIAKGVDTYAFESVSHPGWFMSVNSQDSVVLDLPNGESELFRQTAAWNGESAKVSLESVARPGNWLSHCHGKMQVRGSGGGYFNNDASWQIVEPSRES